MSIEATQFTSASLPEAERREAGRIAQGITAAVVKGLLHRADPRAFAISADVDTLENQAAAAVRSIDAQTFEHMRPKLQQLAADTAKVQKLTGVAMPELKKSNAIIFKPTPPQGAVPRSGSAPQKYRRLDLNLRKLHCVDETNGGVFSPEDGTDDMVLGAIRIGAGGNVDYTKAIVAGEFAHDNTYRNFGELPFGSVSLRTTPGYPKTFYWIFQLVESDSDDAEVAAGITTALRTVVTMVAGMVGGAGIGAIAGAVVDAIGMIIGLFIDDDVFSPYGVAIRLDSENDLGSDGVRDEHTGNISAHGGTYRIGYRLRLV
jgi:hypothetical protein